MPASVSTSCTLVSVPVIVASGSILAETSGITNQTLFTPTATGLYRFSAYIQQNVFTGSSQISMTLGITDNHQSVGLSDPSQTYPGSLVVAFENLSGDAILLTAYVSSGTGAFSYSIYWVIEQLQ